MEERGEGRGGGGEGRGGSGEGRGGRGEGGCGGSKSQVWDSGEILCQVHGMPPFHEELC